MKKNYEITKLERNRFSIVYEDLKHCCICGASQGIELNEVYEGRNRLNSMKYGMVCPLCQRHHKMFHNHQKLFTTDEFDLNRYFKRKFQKKFEEEHTREEFRKIFFISYL